MEFKPLHTKIEKTIQVNNGWIVLESPNGFPRNQSNLYLIELNGRSGWKAEKPEASTLFSRVKINEDNDTFSAYTLDGHACELDLTTGKLISHISMQ